jgi:hypothetical protein
MELVSMACPCICGSRKDYYDYMLAGELAAIYILTRL